MRRPHDIRPTLAGGRFDASPAAADAPIPTHSDGFGDQRGAAGTASVERAIGGPPALRDTRPDDVRLGSHRQANDIAGTAC